VVGQFWKKNSCTAKTAEKKNCARGAMGKKIEQVLSTIQVLCLTLKKVLAEVTAHLKK